MVSDQNYTTIPLSVAEIPAHGFTRTFSDADLALFALMAGQLDLSGEAHLSLDAIPRQPVPQALLSGLLTASAPRLAGQPDHTPISSATLRFIEQAYTDEPLYISGACDASDSTGALRVAVDLHSDDGRLLASGVILLNPS